MTLPPGNSNRDLEQACLLLQEYSFELGGFNPQELTQFWQQTLEVDAAWIRAAVLEALYLGRYKAFSVGQILQMWKRRRQSVRHFNHDFERVVFGPLEPHFSQAAFISAPMNTAAASSPAMAEPDPIPPMAAELPYFNDSEPLPPVAPVEPVTAVPVVHGSAAEPECSEPSEPEALASTEPETSAAESESPLSDPVDETFHTPEPIRKFVPVQQPSGFYSRLQAVARTSP
ncbi:MAG: hypothetical protein ACFB0C_12050 [Leptolyngbyaceae cyanobacterium]